MTKHEIIVQMRKDIKLLNEDKDTPTGNQLLTPNFFIALINDYIKMLNELK